MHPVFTPGARAAVIEAAEEAGAVLPVQALVCVVVLLVVRDDVVHLQQRRAGSDVHHAGRFVLQRKQRHLRTRHAAGRDAG